MIKCLVVLLLFIPTAWSAPVDVSDLSLKARLRSETRTTDHDGIQDREAAGTTFLRVSPSVTLKPRGKAEGLSFVLMPQLQKVFGSVENRLDVSGSPATYPTSGNVAHPDLQVVEAYAMLEKRSFNFLLGRAQMEFGQGMLVSNRNWNNNRQSFDMAKMEVDYFLGMGKSTLFYSQIKEGSDASTDSDSGHFAGLHQAWKGGGVAPDLEFALFYFNDDVINDLYTADIYLDHDHKNFLYRLEAAYQWGKDLSKAHAIKADFGLKLGNRWTIAAGNSIAGENFDPMFQGLHDWFGINDVVGRRNLTTFSLGTSWSDGQDKVSLSGYILTKNDADEIYGIQAGRSKGATPISTSDTKRSTIGREIDLIWTSHYDNDISLEAGYGYFLSGRALRDAGFYNEQFGYLQLSLN